MEVNQQDQKPTVEEKLKFCKAELKRLRTDPDTKNAGNRAHAYLVLDSCQEKYPDTYGTEVLYAKYYPDSDVLYLNTGDTYGTTVLAYIGRDRITFKAINWGSLVESGRY